MMTALLSVGAWAADDVTLSTDFIVLGYNGGGGSYNSGSKTLWVAKWELNGWEFYTSRPISTTEFSGVTIDYESADNVRLVIIYEGGSQQETELLTTAKATVKTIPFNQAGIVREVKFKSYDAADESGGNIVFNSVTLNGISGALEAYPTSNLTLPMDKMKDAGWGAAYDSENQKVTVTKYSWSGWMINLPISATYYKSIHFQLTSVASKGGSIKLTFEDNSNDWIDTNSYQAGGSLDYPLTKGLKQIEFSGDSDDGSTQTYGLGTCYIEPKPITATVSSLKWATYGVNAPINYGSADPSGLKAYIAYVDGEKVKLTEVSKVPANTAVILYADVDESTSYTLTPTETTDDVTGNQLHVSDGTVTGDESGTIYVLADGLNGVGFYRVENGSAITAGKAYLSVSVGARQFIGFGDDNGATGITMVQGEGFMVNGSDNYYDLQGRRVAQPTKGLYIVNGKKVIIK